MWVLDKHIVDVIVKTSKANLTAFWLFKLTSAVAIRIIRFPFQSKFGLAQGCQSIYTQSFLSLFYRKFIMLTKIF